MCERVTENEVIGVDPWRECGEFDGPCDETGVERRRITVCQNEILSWIAAIPCSPLPTIRLRLAVQRDSP